MNKSDFLFFAQKVIDDKVIKAKEYMNSIERSIQGESKSTAGDKHDTTRELMQQERNKAAQNLSNQILDQKTLIHAIEMNDSKGDQDLYVSFRKVDGSWSRPKNLGSTINTIKAENSPFLASDGVTLYFSTNGRPGYGKNDIFMSRRLDDSWVNWSEPENLGPSINTNTAQILH